jgi:aryl-alcohol dehydrogenase-like predicted oxidoreductase
VSFVDAFKANRLNTLVLGAAQLGMRYGIANVSGKPDKTRAAEILSAAWTAGIEVIDTAQAYGDSESVIGAHLRAHPDQSFRVITKLAAAVDHENAGAVVASARLSRDVLGQPLAALMLHDTTSIAKWSRGLQRGLDEILDAGIAEAVGISIYTPAEFQAALEIPTLQVIQAPFNALDRRLLEGGLLARALESGRVLVLRSAFLQGLLLLDAGQVPQQLSFAEPHLARWRSICARHREGCAATAVRYVRRVAPRALIVIGSERAEQVAANARLVAECTLSEDLVSEIEKMPIPEERVINPSLWPPR